MSGVGVARWLIAIAAWVVPGWRRGEWRAEWEAELAELLRRADRVPRRYGPPGLAALRYASGALPHAVWERKQEWTMDRFRGDLRYSLRTLANAPTFTVVAVVTLALGIGANATVFSMANGLLLRAPAGIGEPERLVQIGRHAEPERFDNWPWPAYRAIEERLGTAYDGVAAYAASSIIVGRGVDATPSAAHVVSDDYFDVLRIRPVLGRGFRPDEAGAGAPRVAVISHGLWKRRFRSDPAVVGRDVILNGLPYEVVGVAPDGFAGADVFRTRADVFVPAGAQEPLTGRPGAVLDSWRNSWAWVVARLAPGVSVERAARATRVFASGMMATHPDMGATGAQVVRGVGARPAERAQATTISLLLLGLAVLVLLIACANLGGLVLARAVERRGEIGVRLALGARRGHIVRQLLVESLVIGGASGVLALGIAVLASRGLPAVIPYPIAVALEPDARVLAVTMGIGFAAGVAFGLFPALAAARPGLGAVIRSGVGRDGMTRRGTLGRRILVTGQIALSFVLVAAAALLLRSVQNARTARPGFEPDVSLAVSVDPDLTAGEAGDAAWRFWSAARDRIRALAGVEAVGLSEVLPIVDDQPNRSALSPGEAPPADGPRPAPIFTNTVDDGYFEALGVRVLRGRSFEPADATSGRPVAVVTERLVERFFPNDDPIGRPLPFAAAPDAAPPVVVGVVADHHTRGLDEPPVATVFVPFTRARPAVRNFVIRTGGDADALLPMVLRTIESVDPAVPVLRAAPLRDLVAGSLRATQLTTKLAGVFGVLALVLAAVGLHGLLAYSMARRRREIGVRIALGARAADVLSLVVRQSLGLAAAGVVLGMAAAFAALRLLSGMLYDIRPTEPITLIAMALLLLGVAVVASVGPARNAVRADPIDVLRET